MVLTVTVLSRANTDVVEVAPEKARGQVPVVDANVRESDTVCVGLRRTSGRRPAIAPTTLPIGSRPTGRCLPARLDRIAAPGRVRSLKSLRVSRYPTVWDEIDLAAGVWTVPAARMKTPREHRVPLSVAALKIVTALHEVRVREFVFPRAGQLDRTPRRIVRWSVRTSRCLPAMRGSCSRPICKRPGTEGAFAFRWLTLLACDGQAYSPGQQRSRSPP